MDSLNILQCITDCNPRMGKKTSLPSEGKCCCRPWYQAQAQLFTAPCISRVYVKQWYREKMCEVYFGVRPVTTANPELKSSKQITLVDVVLPGFIGWDQIPAAQSTYYFQRFDQSKVILLGGKLITEERKGEEIFHKDLKNDSKVKNLLGKHQKYCIMRLSRAVTSKAANRGGIGDKMPWTSPFKLMTIPKHMLSNPKINTT